MTKRADSKGPIRSRFHNCRPFQNSNEAITRLGESRTCANLAALMNQTESRWITDARLEIPLPLISMLQLLKPQHLSKFKCASNYNTQALYQITTYINKASICFIRHDKEEPVQRGPHSKPLKIAFPIAGPPKTPTEQLRVWGIQDLCKSCSTDESNRELVDHSRALGDTPPINRQSASNDVPKRCRLERGPVRSRFHNCWSALKLQRSNYAFGEIQDLCKSCSIDETNKELVDHSRVVGDTPPH
ncbi:hypothetical protein CDAR_198021 [Caerostris darwini]|uniref:Uncharacterized protein n=1 Tax=Caerostris darwini TaxID=1538125 RepID=A0AAV4REY3_9ARAC|nr:hypothetical protein CDAR_198021 [Caerostris darwini]